ncbi:MAG: CPBP family intramembrane metalloprotease [Alkalibacterium sp.]|nr:CPBP family intramembrane metalloprotease [Alkalibacterium sp.]
MYEGNTYLPVNDNASRNIKREKAYITIFVIVALMSGWIGLLVDMVIPEQLDEQILGMGIWLVLPFLCGVIIRLVQRDWKGFGIKPKLKGNLKWYVFAVILFPAVTLLFTLISWTFGLVSFTPFSADTLAPVILSLFFGLIIKNIFEDFAWQGFLTPKLVSLKTNDFLIYLVVGLVWAFWHAPYYLYFLPDSIYSTPVDRILDTFVISPIIITVWAVIFVEITRLTGSVWPAVLMHTFEDLIPNFLIFDEPILEFSGFGNVLLNPLSGILPILLYLTIGLWLRKVRRTKEKRI